MYWSWQKSALALTLCFLAAVVLIKPIGVSTQFVIAQGWIAQFVDPSLVEPNPEQSSGYQSSNAYLNQSGGKYAAEIAHPLQYGFVFVLAMIGGGLLASRLQTQRAAPVPQRHQQRFGQSPGKRYLLAFIGGVIVLYGARLAGGCTSGHMMSGMMQTAVSGYLFAASAFAAAVPMALLIYRRGGRS